MVETDDENLVAFCRQVQARSREHQEAMPVVDQNGWRSLAVGILRQELDSLVRTIYLLEQPRNVRAPLIALSVTGQRWRSTNAEGKTRIITDRDMVDFAEGRLDGWVGRVYDFGCRFIHLSSAHDYLARDPFQALPIDDRRALASYLTNYHGAGPNGTGASVDSTFDDIAAYAPRALEKIASHLDTYVERLRSDNRW